jgi:integrase
MADVHNDPATFQEFREALGTRDPKTIATYLTTMRGFVASLAMQPSGTPFHLGLVTETAVRGYMDFLQRAGRTPRTRSRALSALRRFCRWAMDEGYLRRNPARLMERPTVVTMAPTELSEKQRFVLKQLVEQHTTRRFAAIFALGYWTGLRISEIATLRIDQCQINQRAGSITLLDAKGGKTRTLDLHNLARRALDILISELLTCVRRPICPSEGLQRTLLLCGLGRGAWRQKTDLPDFGIATCYEHYTRTTLIGLLTDLPDFGIATLIDIIFSRNRQESEDRFARFWDCTLKHTLTDIYVPDDTNPWA